MDKIEFANGIADYLKEKMMPYNKIEVRYMERLNGVKEASLLVGKDTGHGFMVINIEPFWRDYSKGRCSLEGSSKYIYDQINGEEMLAHFDAEGLTDWNYVKDNVYPRLINTELNKALLESVPHRECLDLSVVYGIRAEMENGCRTNSFLLRSRHMRLWKKTEQEIFNAAMRNMEKEQPSFKNMASVLKELAGLSDCEISQEESPMYVLSNSDYLYGAAEILSETTLENISDYFKDELVIIPSSLHEVLIMPKRFCDDYQTLARMVREVNDSQVIMKERLSYHVYAYDRRGGGLRMAS